MLRGILGVQVLCIGLKLDNLVSWNWKEVFWAYWTTFSVVFGITLGVFLLLVAKTYGLFASKSKLFEVFALLWFFFGMAGVEMCSSGIVTGVIYQMEENFEDVLDIFLLLSIGCLIFFLLLTIALHRTLLKFFMYVSGVPTDDLFQGRERERQHADIESNDEEVLHQEINSNASKKPKKTIIIFPPQPLSIPLYLVFLWFPLLIPCLSFF